MVRTIQLLLFQNEQWGILVRNYNLHKWTTADVVRDVSRMVQSKYSGKLSRRYVFWPMWSENSPSDVALNLVMEFWRWLPERDGTRLRNGLLRPRAKSVSRCTFNVLWALDISSVLFNAWLASCKKTLQHRASSSRQHFRQQKKDPRKSVITTQSDQWAPTR